MIEFIVEGEQENIDRFVSELRDEGIDFRVIRDDPGSLCNTRPRKVYNL